MWGRMDRCIVEWIDGCEVEWMDRCGVGRMDGCGVEWTWGRMDGWMMCTRKVFRAEASPVAGVPIDPTLL